MAVEYDHPQKEDLSLQCREPTLEDLVALCGWLNAEQAHYVVVGGFAIRAAGYNRNTMDVDLLIETGAENEGRVFRALSHLPDNAIAGGRPGEVEEIGVLRVADDYMVDLMKSGCGVTYADAILDAVIETLNGVAIPFASPPVLWRMKQTLREKDIPDKIFLRQWAEKFDVQLDPPPQPSSPAADSWLVRLARWIEHLFGNKKS